ncbi:peptidoglycan DD-metalloendopeptidase family protein [Neomoorella thermoacetica]|uniref:peptidoglycan DD-metalloendopeptidase family protein n=1 Tax=Neomoorella thermoacetica TaxID=1525 RepID=UPI0008FB9291|nr:peptidoglycan DD-metalloendopeptidase family protein [Moorella thermoacetica]OIQ54104.1 murein hydrolase activator NlpD precursor [Moorella thermoacetica]
MPPPDKLPQLAASVGRFLKKLPLRWAGIRDNKGKRILVITGILAGGLLLAAWHQLTTPNALAVFLNGQQVAIVATREQFNRALQEILKERGAGSYQGVRYTDQVDFKAVRANPQEVIAEEQLKSLLAERLHLVAAATVITIDGQPRLVLKDDATADAVLAAFKQAFEPPAAIGQVQEVKFLEQVAYEHRQASPEEILSPEAALAKLKGTAASSSTYTVKEGDSLWSIAREHNLLVDDIKRANPEIQGERLDIGQQLKLTTVQPLLQVMVVYNQDIKEPVPFETRVEKTADLLRGQEKIIQEGTEGEQLVTYQVVTRNGVVVDKKILRQQVLTEPVARVVQQGTGVTALASRSGGSGLLAWPIRGYITSPYGYRGSEFHSGLDIAGSIGEPVGAAAGGVVVSTGYDGGYGRMVVIDHGGLVTRYAHLSGYNVRPGQRVSQGQIIGYVGVSGRTTGPHLHFEVLVGGSFRNPASYLR